MLFCGTLEGFFGLMAAAGVLCCAAPGSLGTAYASRCTKTLAVICASLAAFHLIAISVFSIAVLPEMPHAVMDMCEAEGMGPGHMDLGAPKAMKLTKPLPLDDK